MSTIRVNRFENTSSVGYGAVLQVVNTQTGAVAAGTVAIPADDSIPQNTEGTEMMTATITPKSATNKLKITVVAYVAHTALTTITAALFQDSTANALACGGVYSVSASVLCNIKFEHYMTAGTTSATTFKVRIGGNTASAVTLNGVAGSRVFGGVLNSSITIEEIQV
jgi:hypothetical protein